MRRSVTLALALLALFLSAWFWPEETSRVGSPILNQSSDFTVAAPAIVVQSDEAETHTLAADEHANPAAQNESAQDILREENLKVQMHTIMQSYAEISRFPPHSQPINSPEHLAAFVNMSPPQISTLFPLAQSQHTVTVQLEMANDQYFPGDRIEGRLQVSSVPEGASVGVEAYFQDLQGNRVSPVTVLPISLKDDAHYFAVINNSADHDFADWPMELNLASKVDLNGETLFVTVPFRFNHASAAITGTGYSQPVGSSLHIPMQIDVYQTGYYHLAGVLYSGDASRPLIHLETEGMLQEGAQSLTLQAHIQALRHVADAGPYVLSDVRLTRWSDEHIPHDLAASSGDSVFFIEGYDFDAYDNEPYVDPMQAERQRLMEGLGQL